MKIAIVRGDFLSDWEIPIFEPISKRYDVTMFLGKKPVYKVDIPKTIKVKKLFSPVDLNFGKISRWRMAILNRLFIDAHWLFGLEEELKGFDLIYTAETLYAFSLQSVLAKQKGVVKSVVMHVGENIAFNNEGIWGKRWLKQKCLTGTDKFVAITETAKDVLIQEGAEPCKIVRANPGINLKQFRKLNIKNFKNLKKNSNIKLLIVSRLIEDKGILEMLETFISLNKEINSLELVIAGTGPLEEKVREIIRKENIENKVLLMGKVDYMDMPKVYNLCDIFIHYPKGSKTWAEQFGFVFVEAMACGLPVVTLNRGSAREVVGESGFVVSEKNFKNSIKKLANSNIIRTNLSKRCLKIVREKYNVKTYSKNLEKIFEQTLQS